jgi:hypothetical protein
VDHRVRLPAALGEACGHDAVDGHLAGGDLAQVAHGLEALVDEPLDQVTARIPLDQLQVPLVHLAVRQDASDDPAPVAVSLARQTGHEGSGGKARRRRCAVEQPPLLLGLGPSQGVEQHVERHGRGQAPHEPLDAAEVPGPALDPLRQADRDDQVGSGREDGVRGRAGGARDERVAIALGAKQARERELVRRVGRHGEGRGRAGHGGGLRG